VRLLIAAVVGPVRLIDNCAGVPASVFGQRRGSRRLERIG
jgi:hypothetical protein